MCGGGILQILSYCLFLIKTFFFLHEYMVDLKNESLENYELYQHNTLSSRHETQYRHLVH